MGMQVKKPKDYVGRNEPHILVGVDFRCNAPVGWPLPKGQAVKWLKQALKQLEKCELGACLVSDAKDPAKIKKKHYWYCTRIKP